MTHVNGHEYSLIPNSDGPHRPHTSYPGAQFVLGITTIFGHSDETRDEARRTDIELELDQRMLMELSTQLHGRHFIPTTDMYTYLEPFVQRTLTDWYHICLSVVQRYGFTKQTWEAYTSQHPGIYPLLFSFKMIPSVYPLEIDLLNLNASEMRVATAFWGNVGYVPDDLRRRQKGSVIELEVLKPGKH